MEFGPKIEVDGKRPEWLGSYSGYIGYIRDKEDQYGPGAMWTERDILGNRQGWKTVTGLFLPANHPHYQQNTPTPDERAVALVKRLVKNASPDGETRPHPAEYWGMVVEARAIVAALEPVDPMLLEARQVVADLYTGGNVSHLREQALSGDGDEWFHTKVARAALRRGRQLEKEGK